MTMRRQLALTTLAPTALCAILLHPASARASQEQIHPWRSAAVTVETDLFGQVQVSWSATPGTPRLDALTVKLRGKTLAVPANALKTVTGVTPAAMAVHTERGYDKDPWLYVVFELAPGSSKVMHRWAYFAFQAGKLAHVSVKSRTKDNQYRFDKRRF